MNDQTPPNTNWQSIGEIALILAQEKARHRANDPGLSTANKEDSRMHNQHSAPGGFNQ